MQAEIGVSVTFYSKYQRACFEFDGNDGSTILYGDFHYGNMGDLEA